MIGLVDPMSQPAYLRLECRCGARLEVIDSRRDTFPLRRVFEEAHEYCGMNGLAAVANPRRPR